MAAQSVSNESKKKGQGRAASQVLHPMRLFSALLFPSLSLLALNTLFLLFDLYTIHLGRIHCKGYLTRENRSPRFGIPKPRCNLRHRLAHGVKISSVPEGWILFTDWANLAIQMFKGKVFFHESPCSTVPFLHNSQLLASNLHLLINCSTEA